MDTVITILMLVVKYVLMLFAMCQLLDLLWELAHLPMLKTSLVELALEEHLAVLSDPFGVKEQVKKQYVIKCVEDIREVRTVRVCLLLLCAVCPFSALMLLVEQHKGHLFYETLASCV